MVRLENSNSPCPNLAHRHVENYYISIDFVEKMVLTTLALAPERQLAIRRIAIDICIYNAVTRESNFLETH